MKPFAPLAVAALAVGVWAWQVVPDYGVVHVVLAKGRRNWLGMSLPGMRLQRRARLAWSKWPVRVTR
jgi:hypothetical protein